MHVSRRHVRLDVWRRYACMASGYGEWIVPGLPGEGEHRVKCTCGEDTYAAAVGRGCARRRHNIDIDI